MSSVDAFVIGAGPNGLAAAITLAEAGVSVKLVEAADTIGGGARTKELTLPGFRHDVCSAIHPMGATSEFFRRLPLEKHGLTFLQPQACVAHPLPDGTAAVLYRSLDETARRLGADGEAWTKLFGPLLKNADTLVPELLAPPHVPRHPFAMARFGLLALRSARGLAEARFRSPAARALFAGVAAHSMLPLEAAATAAAGLVLSLQGHVNGWPVAKGGSQSIVDALASHLSSLGGEIETSHRVASISELPPAAAYVFDVTPRQLVALAGDRLPGGYKKRLARYRHGPGAFKVDFAIDGPIPWTAKECLEAGTVHVGGTLDEISASEAATSRGLADERPFVLVGQQSLFDPSRAPEGKHTVWAYAHVPNGSTLDMRERIEAQIERFAPGFRDRILARNVMTPADFERYNENDVGGDIGGGLADLGQLIFRPIVAWDPYATPDPSITLCSSSTPPGAGVHGLCGYFAARSVLRRVFRKRAH